MGIIFNELGIDLDDESMYDVDMCALSELALKHKSEYDKLFKKYKEVILEQQIELLYNTGLRF